MCPARRRSHTTTGDVLNNRRNHAGRLVFATHSGFGSPTGGAGGSFSMISLHNATQSSQMKTPGPATKRRTWSLDLPQNEHRTSIRLRPMIGHRVT